MIIALNFLRLVGKCFSPILKLLRLLGFYKDKNHDPRAAWARKYLAYKFLKGDGLEIGALHKPLAVSPGVTVKYVDRLSAKDLRNQYPELKDLKIINPDIVENGETLASVENESQDFIIANHFIEHCENPVGTLLNHLSKLRPSGILFYALPHRDNTFDANRPLTSVDHLLQDYKDNGVSSRENHFKEFAKLTKGLDSKEAELEAKKLMNQNYSIHFHVWTPDSFKVFLDAINSEFKPCFEIVESLVWKYAKSEFLVVLRKI
ncbi:MAG: hypothetical protein KDD56_05280 [Bdellovibrionales bacterium]|nr:hypothetical protein [Bdellovibrionales bacterium]